MQGYSAILTGIFVSFALIVGAPLHSLVPHGHAHDASGGEAYIWQSLHSSLHHEGKKSLPVSDALVILFTMLVATVGVRIPRVFAIVDAFTDSLKRGILPHRAFG